MPQGPATDRCLKVASWNVGKLTFAKWLEVCDAIINQRIDIFALVDARTTMSGVKQYRHDLTRRPAPLCFYHLDVVPLPDKKGPNAGGCIVLASARFPIRKLSPILPFGSLIKAETSFGPRQIILYLAYLPETRGTSPGSLLRATLDHLKMQHLDQLGLLIHMVFFYKITM
jgi:hypothetical protein